MDIDKNLEECLYEAISLGNLEEVAYFVDQGAKVNWICQCGHSILGRAAQVGNVDVFRSLLGMQVDSPVLTTRRNLAPSHSQGSTVPLKSKVLFQPASRTSDSSSDDESRSFVRQERKRKVRPKSLKLKNPLNSTIEKSKRVPTKASQPHSRDLIPPKSITVDKKYDVNISDIYGRRPLHYAAEQGHLHLTRLLLSVGALVDAVDIDSTTSLYLASSRGHLAVVEMLISCSAGVNLRSNDKSSPLHAACSRGHVEVARCLLQHNAKIDALDYSDRTPLYLAVARSHKPVVDLLLSWGAKVNLEEIHGYTCLCEAVWHLDVDIVSLLIQHGVRITQSHRLLHFTVLQKHVELAQLLLRAGCVPNLRDDYGDTPLHLACRVQHLDSVKLLLQKGANPNYPNSYTGILPLHELTAIPDSAVELFDTIVTVLQDWGCKLSLESYTPGDTPLFRLLEQRKLDLALCLVQHGANPNKGTLVSCPTINNLSLARRYGAEALPLIKALVYAGFDLTNAPWSSIQSSSSPTLADMWLLNARSSPWPLTQLCTITVRRYLGDKMYSQLSKASWPTYLKNCIWLKNLP